MWSRAELKERAKEVLSKIYWSAFGVSLVIALAGGNQGGGGGNSHSSGHGSHYYFSGPYSSFINWHTITTTIVGFGLLFLALRIFIGYSLEVGGRRFFIKSAERTHNGGCFSFGFDSQNYGGIVKTMFMTKLFILLWTLLLIIPGIIKAYAYRMVPYILADNPNLGVMEAISLSNEMTMGHKFDMFVLDLSFLGWYFLGALAFGIGILFVFPYENATNAELYLLLREDAVKRNLCTREDLLLNHPAYTNNYYDGQ